MFPHHSLIPWGSFRGRQEEKWGSFRGRDHFGVEFGDHFRVGDHFGVGIISGAVQNKSLTMCSFDLVFRKDKQDSAFPVSGVL